MESPQYTSLSLFGGEELLGSLYPAAKSATYASDGWGQGVLASTPTEPLSPASDYQGSSPFGSEWLDTRVDLLDYLAGSELEGLRHEELVTVSTVELVPEDSTARAVQVLRSIAEDQSALLRQDALDNQLPSPASQSASTEQPHSVEVLVASTGPPHSSVEEAALQADLFGLFPETLDESVVDSALDPSSILAPMSPEDIDDILSSGPCSPEVSMEGPYSGELDVSLGNLDSSTEVSGMHTIDLSADLVQLLQQVQAPASPPVIHTPASPPVIQAPASPSVIQAPVLITIDGQYTAGNHSPVYSTIGNQSPVYSPQYSPASSSDSDYTPDYRPKPYERPRKPGSKKGVPREVIQAERKQRKKQQNKDAATRYRQKKKAEQGNINEECDILEARNTVLHDQVDSMTKEINYLKDLLAEVYAARGLKLPISAK